ncbi:MAG TPA: NAD(+) kinase [Fervidobacterium sp.]|nr:NAD(+) kinase [Fervidobacterium sp.]
MRISDKCIDNRIKVGVSYRRDYESSAKLVLDVLNNHNNHVNITFFVESSSDFTNLPQCDIIIVVGGDGTVLRTLKKSSKPVIGIKAGRLGFFSGYRLDELDKLVADLEQWNFVEDKRWILVIEAEGKYYHAINDAILQRDPNQKILDFDVQMSDGEFYYHADGVIVSTPTGSSAYSLALGGPIMLPNVEAFVITPIAPQFLATRSLIIPSSENIKITVNDSVNLVIDGDVVKKVKEINIKKSSKKVSILRPVGYDFSTSIKEKIGYGRNVFGLMNGNSSKNEGD